MSFKSVLLVVVLYPASGMGGVEVRRGRVEGGTHWRIAAPEGVIHLLRPEGLCPKTAGTVLYVHGFNTKVDRAWKEDHLPAQMLASGLNAVFVAVSAPRSLEDAVKFPDLGRVLRLARHGVKLPQGPVVAVGHSGGYWTIANWLDHKRLSHVILLDGMYGFVSEYRGWITKGKRRRMVFVARGTRRLSLRLVRSVKGAVLRKQVPLRYEHFSQRERQARVLHLGSQYSHSGIVRSRKVIPVVLRLTRIGRIPPKD